MRDDTDLTRAGFMPRAAAYLIDRLLLVIALTAVRLPAYIAALLGHSAFSLRAFLFQYSALDVLCWLLGAVYFTLTTYYLGGTPGKLLMRLNVQSRDGSPLRFADVLYRETVGRFLSRILCLGYLMALADRENRAFHDWLCGTGVVYSEIRFRKKAPAQSPVYAIPGQTPALSEAGSAPEAAPEPEPEPEATPEPETEKEEAPPCS